MESLDLTRTELRKSLYGIDPDTTDRLIRYGRVRWVEAVAHCCSRILAGRLEGPAVDLRSTRAGISNGMILLIPIRSNRMKFSKNYFRMKTNYSI